MNTVIKDYNENMWFNQEYIVIVKTGGKRGRPKKFLTPYDGLDLVLDLVIQNPEVSWIEIRDTTENLLISKLTELNEFNDFKSQLTNHLENINKDTNTLVESVSVNIDQNVFDTDVYAVDTDVKSDLVFDIQRTKTEPEDQKLFVHYKTSSNDLRSTITRVVLV